MAIKSKIKYMLYGAVALTIIIFAVIGIFASFHLLPVGASEGHTYHANMISKSFSPYYTTGESGTAYMHKRADKFVDHVRNYGDYNVHIAYTRNSATSTTHEHVTLTRKAESPYQKKMIKLLTRLQKSHVAAKGLR